MPITPWNSPSFDLVVVHRKFYSFNLSKPNHFFDVALCLAFHLSNFCLLDNTYYGTVVYILYTKFTTV